MAILSWVIMGALVGLSANWLVASRFPGGIVGTVVGGTLGAVLGGLIFSIVLGRGVTGFDVISLLIAFAGAAVLLTLLRKAGHAEPRTR